MPASNLPAHTAGTDDDPGPSASAGHVSMMNDVLISQRWSVPP